jgi:hypothetical protein
MILFCCLLEAASSVSRNGMSRSSKEETIPTQKPAQHLSLRKSHRDSPRIPQTIGIDLGYLWSHYCTLKEDDEVVDRGRFRTTPKGIEKWFTDVPRDWPGRRLRLSDTLRPDPGRFCNADLQVLETNVIPVKAERA